MAERGCLTELITSWWACRTVSGLGCLGDKKRLALWLPSTHQLRGSMGVNKTAGAALAAALC